MSLLRRLSLGEGDLTVDSSGIAKVSLPESLLHGNFTFNIPDSWLMYENSTLVYVSTEISSVNGEARVATAGTNTDVYLESRECARHQPDRGVIFSALIRCPNKTIDCTREWGQSTNETGVKFRLKAGGQLYAVITNTGIDTHEELIDTSSLANFNVEMDNLYHIQYADGNGLFTFFIVNPKDGLPKQVHQINLVGTISGLAIFNSALPVRFRTIQGASNEAIYIGHTAVTSENGGQLRTSYKSVYTENVPTAASTLVPILAVHQPLQINTVTNTRSLIAVRMSVNNSKKSNFKLWITSDASAITGGTFKAIGGGSFVETDSSLSTAGAVRITSVDINKLKFVTSIEAEASVRTEVSTPRDSTIRLSLVRGEYFIITCVSSGVGSADAVLEWGEEV